MLFFTKRLMKICMKYISILAIFVSLKLGILKRIMSDPFDDPTLYAIEKPEIIHLQRRVI